MSRQIINLLYICLTLLYSFNSCTGINLRTWPIPIGPNTHPSLSYGEASVVSKGGFFYHRSSSIIFTSSEKIIRTGRACSHSIFFLFAFGDSSIDSAKVNGGVGILGIVEQDILAFGGIIYHRHCTIVGGE